MRVLLERADTMAGWCRLGEENPGFLFGLERGEDWCWCYVDEITFQVELAGVRP